MGIGPLPSFTRALLFLTSGVHTIIISPIQKHLEKNENMKNTAFMHMWHNPAGVWAPPPPGSE